MDIDMKDNNNILGAAKVRKHGSLNKIIKTQSPPK